MQHFIDHLENLKISVADVIEKHQPADLLNCITRIKDVIVQFDKSHSGSWWGYHSRVYYENFQKPPVGNTFSIVWGLDETIFNEGTKGPWIEYEYDFVIELIKLRSGFDEYDKIRKYCIEIENNYSKLKQEFLSIITLIKSDYTDDYIFKLESDVDNIKFLSRNFISDNLNPKKSAFSRDEKAMSNGCIAPPHEYLLIEILAYETRIENCKKFIWIIDNIINHLLKISSINEDQKKIKNVNSNSIIKGNNISNIRLFISHSSKDKIIIADLISVFQSSIKGLNDEDIRCSSVKGYKFRPGEDFLDMIKNESSSCEYILSVFSKNSLTSSMVLFECGIGWYKNKVIPIIIDKKIDFKNLPQPYQSKETKKVFEKGDILELVDHLADILNLKKNASAKIVQLVDEFIDKHFKINIKEEGNKKVVSPRYVVA